MAPAGRAMAVACLLGSALVAGCQAGTRFDPRGDGPAPAPPPLYESPDLEAFDNAPRDAAVLVVTPDAFLPPEVCADVEATPERVRPAVTLVVDGSGSMACAYPEPSACDCDGQLRDQCDGGTGPSRWQALERALFAPDGVVARLGPVVDFGLVLFHDPPNADRCPTLPVDLPVHAAPSAADLAGAFPRLPPGANTPTALALAHALSSLPDGSESRPQHLVLATDGKPHTCFDSVTLEPPEIDYDAVLDAVRAGRARDVTVHVLSVAPAAGDFADHLMSVADAGGSGSAHIPRDRGALVRALEDVVAAAIDCTVTLDGEVDDGLRCAGSVTLSGRALACEADDDGYRMLDASRLALLGEACTEFKRDPDAELSVSFPCKAFQAR